MNPARSGRIEVFAVSNGCFCWMDGAGHWTILWRICVPTSLAALATLVLFAAVTHWNA